jgi:hypothetical protein
MTGPCLWCGTVDELVPGRPGGVDVYCLRCALTLDLPQRMGAKRERKLSPVQLSERGITNLPAYRARQN